MSAKKNTNLTIVSYFCGCGGLDLGFTGGFTYNNINFENMLTKSLFEILEFQKYFFSNLQPIVMCHPVDFVQ